MARDSLSTLINAVNNAIQENTSGDITATVLNSLLQQLTNNLYLPSQPTFIAQAEGAPVGNADTINLQNLSYDFTGSTLTIIGPTVQAGVQLTNVVSVNQPTDLPAAVGGVRTLADETIYLFGANVSVGTDRFVMGSNTVVRGLGSLNTTLTYTGTGDMFTCTDVTSRVEGLRVNCTSGRIFNWTDTVGGKQIGLNDVLIDCDRIGTFTGLNSIFRFSQVSNLTITTDGIDFAGSWTVALWETGLALLSAGTLFDLGSATFDTFIADKILTVLSGGSTFLSGLAGSANISVGGTGAVLTCRFSGAGTLLSGVTVDDARWEFFHNDDIADTRPDGLLSMTSNATATDIITVSTPVLVAGTWVVERTSQFTGTVAGRLTFDGGKDFTTPITASLSVAPTTGTNITIRGYIAINGTFIPSSFIAVRANAGAPLNMTIPWQTVLAPGDYVEVFVSNETNDTDVLVSSAKLRMN